jgi:hypothetical protein
VRPGGQQGDPRERDVSLSPAGETVQCQTFQNSGAAKTLTADARFVRISLYRIFGS